MSESCMSIVFHNKRKKPGILTLPYDNPQSGGDWQTGVARSRTSSTRVAGVALAQ